MAENKKISSLHSAVQERRNRKLAESNRDSMVVHPGIGGRIADIVIILVLALIAFICLIPL